METYTPGMGSAQPVGPMPVEKLAYDTKNRMMQMDMMGMRSRAAADAAMRQKQLQEEKNIWDIKPGDADYLTPVATKKYNAALQQMLSLKEKGQLGHPQKTQIAGGLEASVNDLKSLAVLTKAQADDAVKGYESLYNPDQLKQYLINKQIQTYEKGGEYDRTALGADIEEAKKQLKTYNEGAINDRFIEEANKRKNKVVVKTNPTGKREVTRDVYAQAYWKVNPKTAKLEGFDYDAFIEDYTKPGTITGQLYAANKQEKLKDPNFSAQYNAEADAIKKQYATDPTGMQTALRKLDAEKFVKPSFGQDKRMSDFFALDRSFGDVSRYEKPTSEEMEEKEASKYTGIQVEIITDETNKNIGYQTRTGLVMTKKQADGIKPDAQYGHVMKNGMLRPAGKSIRNISAGASTNYDIVGRTSFNTNGISAHYKGKPANIPEAIKKAIGKDYFAANQNSFSAGGDLNIEKAKQFVNALKQAGLEPMVKSKAGVMIPIQDFSDVANIPGVLDSQAYVKIDLPEGQEKPVGPAPKTSYGVGADGKLTTTQSATYINLGTPGTPKSVFFNVKVGSAIKETAMRNLGKEQFNKIVEEVKAKQRKSVNYGIGGQPAQPKPAGNKTEEEQKTYDFE
jgi:hypothetical protein